MFFCSSVEKKRKLKASNEKRSGIISETLSEKTAKVLGRCKTTPAPKTKMRSLTYCYKKMSGQPSANSQNQPLKTPNFAPFTKVRKITQIVSH